MADVTECFRVKELGKVFCYVVEDNVLYLQEVEFEEVSMDELPDSARQTIREMMGGGTDA